MPEKMEYHPLISDLETVMSYGSLGVVDCIVRRINDNPNIKKNVILINGLTIIRNCFNDHKEYSANKLMEAVALDFDKLKHAIEMYAGNQKMIVVVYFHPNIYKLIPEQYQKSLTDFRKMVYHVATLITNSDHLQPNIPKKMLDSDNITFYAVRVTGSFAYRVLSRLLHSLKGLAPKIWMVSHQPVDFFLIEEFPHLEVILSHTGKILQRKDLSKKVFGDETIPFNRITYKLFGDKDLIKAVIRNRPKALDQLKGVNLKLRTEREITMIAKNTLGLDPKSYSWEI